MAKKSMKVMLLARRAKRVRTRVQGTPGQPRLSVYRSLKHIYGQIIDDTSGRTLAAASSVGLKIAGNSVGAARQVGKVLGERAKEHGIERVRFDRNGRLYHGRVKAVADGARDAGLQF